MNNHTEKLALLIGKFDDGSISDFEITELSDLIDINGDAITSNIDGLLNNITPEVSQSQIEFLDNYLDKLNQNFATSNTNSNNLNSNPSNNFSTPSNTFNVLPGVNGFSLNSTIIGLKVSSILTTLGILSIASVAYFSLNWNTQSMGEYDNDKNNKETVVSNSSDEKSSELTNELKNLNQSNSNNIEVANNVVTNNESQSNEIQNKELQKIEIFNKSERLIYSEELISMINANNSKINELVVKLKTDLKVATDSDNTTQQVNILYQLGVIYRIKNISAVKSVELLDKAKEIALTSRVNLNFVQLSDIYGELYKSNKLLNNNTIAEENLKNCINFLNQAKSVNNNKNNNYNNKIANKLEYWNNKENY